ncbi:RNA-binding S4 domain-containing protein [bacterium]|nr:RNA-binding S4 domain-containing protein [candidate division CSSED10-310 bacterium]
MRLDKFLKVSRLVRQRPRAKILCDAGAVEVNGKTARAGRLVETGDELMMIIGNRRIRAVIRCVPEGNVSKDAASTLVDIREEVWIDEQE